MKLEETRYNLVFPFLYSQTRILVTHGIHFLPQCDMIVVMKEGKISEVGSYNELIDADGAFAEFIRVYSGPAEDEEEGAPSESVNLRYSMALSLYHVVLAPPSPSITPWHCHHIM